MNILPLFLINILIIILLAFYCSAIEKSDDLYLSVNDSNEITLKARSASLQTVVAQIGTKMDFKVISQLEKDVEITEDYTDVSLEKLLKKLRVYADIVFIKDKSQDLVDTVLIFPLDREQQYDREAIISRSKQQSTNVKNIKTGGNKSEDSKAQPQQFVFDPSKHIKKEEE